MHVQHHKSLENEKKLQPSNNPFSPPLKPINPITPYKEIWTNLHIWYMPLPANFISIKTQIKKKKKKIQPFHFHPLKPQFWSQRFKKLPQGMCFHIPLTKRKCMKPNKHIFFNAKKRERERTWRNGQTEEKKEKDFRKVNEKKKRQNEEKRGGGRERERGREWREVVIT